jgi:hypothetical protein
MTKGSFCDSDSLSFATTNSSDEIITNSCVLCVLDSEHSHCDISKVLSILAASRIGRNSPRAAGSGGEVEGIPNGHVGKMSINLGRVDSFPPESSLHLLGGDTLVVNVRLLADMKTMSITGDELQQCRAA